jgi:hypothetical protein
MADMNARSGWSDEDTYWRTNYRTRPYASSEGSTTITSRAIDTATKRQIGSRIEAGTTSKPTYREIGTRTNTAVVRPGSR